MTVAIFSFAFICSPLIFTLASLGAAGMQLRSLKATLKMIHDDPISCYSVARLTFPESFFYRNQLQSNSLCSYALFCYNKNKNLCLCNYQIQILFLSLNCHLLEHCFEFAVIPKMLCIVGDALELRYIFHLLDVLKPQFLYVKPLNHDDLHP